jgi:hypothetical protein
LEGFGEPVAGEQVQDVVEDSGGVVEPVGDGVPDRGVPLLGQSVVAEEGSRSAVMTCYVPGSPTSGGVPPSHFPDAVAGRSRASGRR